MGRSFCLYASVLLRCFIFIVLRGIVRPDRKFQPQSAVDAFHETPCRRHHDPEMNAVQMWNQRVTSHVPPLLNPESPSYPWLDSLLCPSVGSSPSSELCNSGRL